MYRNFTVCHDDCYLNFGVSAMPASKPRKKAPAPLDDAGVEISKKSTDLQSVEFRKANDSIGLRVIEGRFSLFARRLYNAFLYRAQIAGSPGKNAPVDSNAADNYFWIPMPEVIRDIDFNSNNYAVIKEHAQELLNIRVVGETDKMWTSERLLSGVKIYNSAGLRSKGGTVWLGYAFPPEVLEMVLKPNTYTKLSLYYQTILRSGASLALYEVTRRYATSPSHLTSREKWQKWYQIITSNPIGNDLPQFKYFKRDVLRGAIAEINAMTDIEVELLEFKKGRTIDELQFRVNQTSQAALRFLPDPIIDMEVIGRIKGFGISEKEATEIYLSNDREIILANVDLVEKRLKSKHAAPLESPAGYFKSSLKSRFAEVKKAASDRNETFTLPLKPAPAPGKKKSVRERFLIARSDNALRYFAEIRTDEQQGHFTEFSLQSDKSLKPYLKKGLGAPIIKSAFGAWLATKLWGEPTDTMIIDFLEREGVD